MWQLFNHQVVSEIIRSWVLTHLDREIREQPPETLTEEILCELEEQLSDVVSSPLSEVDDPTIAMFREIVYELLAELNLGFPIAIGHLDVWGNFGVLTEETK